MCFVVYAYGDDGSDEKCERVTAVSVIAGREDWWEEVESQWLVRCGGRSFHATDCESDQKDFAPEPGREDETHQENKELYRDLTGILAASKVGGIAIAIDHVAERRIFPDAPPIAYHKAFVECLEGAANVAECFDDVCKVTYDISEQNEYNAGQLYAWLRERDERLCRRLHPELSFVHWKESARLQAADLLAFEAWKALDHAVGPVHRTRRSWQLLRATGRFETLSYSEEWFADLKTHVDSGDLEKVVGYSESNYKEWLIRNKRQHSMSNLFAFLRERA
jgi:hypothetical protein